MWRVRRLCRRKDMKDGNDIAQSQNVWVEGHIYRILPYFWILLPRWENWAQPWFVNPCKSIFGVAIAPPKNGLGLIEPCELCSGILRLFLLAQRPLFPDMGQDPPRGLSTSMRFLDCIMHHCIHDTRWTDGRMGNFESPMVARKHQTGAIISLRRSRWTAEWTCQTLQYSHW